MKSYIRLAGIACALSILAPNNPLRTLVSFGIIGYLVAEALIPRLAGSFIKIGLKGKDMSKPPPVEEIAESMGAVSAVTYLLVMFWMIPFVFFKYLVNFSTISDDVRLTQGYSDQYEAIPDNKLFPHNKLAEYLGALLCLESTVLLGIFDDLFDIRWRHKLFLPVVASIPLLIVYYVDFSVTSVVVPSFIPERLYGGDLLLSLISNAAEIGNIVATKTTGLIFTTLDTTYATDTPPPKLLDLGIFYYFYMAAVAIFAPNSINILAGINGLEVGQSIVLSLIFLINDFCYLLSANVSAAAYDSHLFSAIFLIPFLGVSLALLKYNWCPAQVFVGDTYCYFSGMVFAIVGILGHFSKTLLVFFLPQILNFLYSSPQLFLVLPCPRHRLPRFNLKDGLLYPSFAYLKNPSKIQVLLLRFLCALRLIDLQSPSVAPDSTQDNYRFSNLTIINLCLVWFGPMTESRLCILLLSAQFVTGILMIIARHTLGPWLLGYDNLSWGVK